MFGSIAAMLGLFANSGVGDWPNRPTAALAQVAGSRPRRCGWPMPGSTASRPISIIPAISAGVVSNERLIWSKGYGTIDAAHRVAATRRPYSICSNLELFTSVALMQLYEAARSARTSR